MIKKKIFLTVPVYLFFPYCRCRVIMMKMSNLICTIM